MSSTIDFNSLEPVSQHVFCLKQLGADYWMWDPETRKISLKRKGIELTLEGENKLEAIVTLLCTDLPWLHFECFEKVTKGLNGEIPDFVTIEKCLPHEIVYSIHIFKGLKPNEKFSLEVKNYIAACLYENGNSIIPKSLTFIKPQFDKLVENKPLVKHFQQLDLTKEEVIKKALSSSDYGPQVKKLLIITNYLRQKEEKLRKENV
jgi:hypothetical protein